MKGKKPVDAAEASLRIIEMTGGIFGELKELRADFDRMTDAKFKKYHTHNRAEVHGPRGMTRNTARPKSGPPDLWGQATMHRVLVDRVAGTTSRLKPRLAELEPLINTVVAELEYAESRASFLNMERDRSDFLLDLATRMRDTAANHFVGVKGVLKTWPELMRKMPAMRRTVHELLTTLQPYYLMLGRLGSAAVKVTEHSKG